MSQTTDADAVTEQGAAARAAIAAITGPGGPSEMRTEQVLGAPVAVFVERYRALHEVLADSVRHGDRPYVVSLEATLTFAEHARRVSSLAQVLREEHGVRSGDRVAIAAANSPAWIESFWAVVSIGAIAVGCNAWWSPREVAQALELTSPVLVLADERRREASGSTGVPVLDLESGHERRCTAHPEAPLPSADVDEDDPCVILFTSGTSGRPKGAVHTHRNLCAVLGFHRHNDVLSAMFGDPVAPEDKVYLLAMPLFHIGSLHNLTVPRLAGGSTVALHLGAFDPARVLQLVQEAGVTHWGAVPTMANRLLAFERVRDYDTSSLYAFSLASAPSSVAFQDRLREHLPFAGALVDSYGLTESCTAVAVATPADLLESPGTLGAPIIGVEMEVRDALGERVTAGVEGDICVRSAYNMLGYWADDAATRAAFDDQRWLRTGDIGTLDEKGRVRLSARRSDLIIRGGENVYPAETEAVLAEHPAVAECVVLGVPDDDLGQQVAAVVVTRDGAATDGLEQALQAHVAAELAHYKVPTRWRITAEPLPRNATGKVRRPDVTVTT
ncbi:class I adenylate-forming enzyme family protein [Nocardioides sp. cx-173]|uniref:class I adenylate-forming enzyme family protein n=1 Tax=Nocardioides sp. cx-173 TaxID=2898796 RepID=UPI001E3A19CB|nr:class I adenylate-forming enzyme family protein [Nocardioides sp. cx-173]MCD4523569.1 acyl--CoA ligase [Nocardioides sp. cx-173]UGB42095.1 acyl--CoA ligase [Nocardioides sp. cx-173]